MDVVIFMLFVFLYLWTYVIELLFVDLCDQLSYFNCYFGFWSADGFFLIK